MSLQRTLTDTIQTLLHSLGYQLCRFIPRDFSSEDEALFRRVQPYTLTSPERIFGCCRAVEHVIHNNIPGAIVECGTWRGGSMMAMALTLVRLNHTRDLYLFDTFEGMTAPSSLDVDFRGASAGAQLAKSSKHRDSTAWAYATLDEVQRTFRDIPYDAGRIHFIKGRVEDTIPAQAPQDISVLRLDTDWYESTRHEMQELFPRLARGGLLIIDDYGHWQGARRAVDDYIASQGLRLFLHRIDYTGRIAVKP